MLKQERMDVMQKQWKRSLRCLVASGIFICICWMCACGQQNNTLETTKQIAPADVSMEGIDSELGSERVFDGQGCVEKDGTSMDDWKVQITVNQVYRSDKKLSELPTENIRYDVWNEIEAGQLTDHEMHVWEDKTEGIVEQQIPMTLVWVEETIKNIGEVPVKGVSIVGNLAPVNPQTREFIPRTNYQNTIPENVYIDAYGKNDRSEHNNTSGYRPGMIYLTELQPGESADVLLGYAVPDAAMEYPMGILHTGFGDDDSYRLEKVVIIGYVE